MENSSLIKGPKTTRFVVERANDVDEDPNENVSSLLLDNEVPQGRHLGLFSTVNLFVSRIIGGGIYAVPSSIFINCGGNTSLFFCVWICAAIMAFIGMSMFLELGAILPKSGGRKNFLEFLYDKPRMITTVVICTFCIMTCFAISPAMILGKYILYAIGYDETFVNEETRASNYIAIGSVLAIVFIHGLSLNHGLVIQNVLGGIKLIIILIMIFTGVYVIGFYDKTTKPDPSFLSRDDPSKVIPISSSSLTAAFIQCFYCFAGWDTVHSVTSEIKNPNRTLKLAGPFSLLIALLCYLCLNFAYVKVLSYEEIENAGPLLGSVLFSKLFGESIGAKFITVSIILSAGSNLFVTVYGVSRMNQEIFREGLFPFSAQLARNWPYNSPLPSLLVCGIVSCFWLYLLPATGPAFDYLINFEGYANQIMLLLIATGLLFNVKRLDSSTMSPKASKLGIIFFVLLSLYLTIGPFLGDETRNTVSSFPPYEFSVFALILLSVLFWFVKFVMFPKIFGYTLQKTLSVQKDGLTIINWKTCTNHN